MLPSGVSAWGKFSGCLGKPGFAKPAGNRGFRLDSVIEERRRRSVHVTQPDRGDADQGWSRQQMQIPEDLRKIFAAESRYRGQGSVKILGALAVGALLGMPAKARDRAYLKVTRASWGDGKELTPERVFEFFMQSIEEAQEEDEQTSGTLWEVTRILDPELTPPPGEKLSDREESEQRRKSG
eukprot:g16414.t1